LSGVFIPLLQTTDSRIVLTWFLFSIFLLAGCANKSVTPTAKPAAPATVSENKRIASIDVVKAEVQPIAINAGSVGEAVVRLTIQKGYHINANPPTFRYLKATELEVEPSEGVSVSSIYYPPPLNRQFTFAEKPLAVYEGDTELKATLKADQSTKRGERSIPARLRIQACDDEVCYPPGTLDLKIPVSIK
jgi:thioredoxin:protein disulfide reductase